MKQPIAYMRQLDGLRAIAVGMVFIEHWTPARSPLHLIPFGAFGVHLFFVLSGFLITSILLRSRPKPTGEPGRRQLLVFYTRRFLRIFPAYYALLAALFLLDVGPIRKTIGWHASYLSNFYFALRHVWQGSEIHFWSLAAEEQFYVCVPWLLIFLPTRILPVAIGILPLAGWIGRLLMLDFGFDLVSVSILPVSSCDTLGFGGFLAWHAWRTHDRGDRSWDRGLAWLGALGLVALGLLETVALKGDLRPISLFGPTSLALFFGWLVWRAAHGFGGIVGRLLASGPVVYLGRISYGLYLFHNFAPPLYASAFVALKLPTVFGFWWLRVPILFAMTLATAAFSWRYFEQPLLELKRFVPYARGRR